MTRLLAGATLMIALAAPTLATAEVVQSKKEKYLEQKQRASSTSPEAREKARRKWQRELARQIGRKPVGVISIYNG